ncbi:uncharacterized protein LOC660622 isoform X1 [Tribolium castaneum]|uniref:uncharacterized protein LOC660622 isoform X1 n=1 Tax=Tribolium castaneum TaxID=7070 RepID=UPI00046C1A88
MRRGMPNADNKFRHDASKTDKHTLGNLDLLNLRFSSPPDKFKNKLEKEAASGDNRLPEKTKLRHSFQRLNLGESKLCKDYAQTKTTRKPTTARVDPTIDDFLLPPGKRNSREFSSSRSTFQLSSAGDAGNFPFKVTPSGNLKVNSQQVVFESKKLSVLVANPERTQIKIYSDESSDKIPKKMAYGSGEFTRNSAMDAILSQVTGGEISGLGSIIGDTPARSMNKVSSEYESKQTSEILDPELNLCRLGYTGSEPIDWNKVTLPEKKDLYLELCKRITNKRNADCKVHIGREEFSCHLVVLQCYSELFDGYIAIKKVEIPAEKCSAASFAFIYDWMVSEDQSYKYLTRENVLDIFNSAKYLKIKDLVEQCWAFVDNCEVFNEDTAFLLYVNAKQKRLEEVHELMVPRIQDFFLILVSSQDWLELGVEDVKNLLSSNYIRINCEMEVFMSAVRWLKYDWANRDKYKYEVLKCVRFGNIAAWQLVDIKRNPENPEFMELAKDPAICKLIDDGLAFVIIKHWYDHDNDDFQHWNSVLGLQEPPARNWSGLDKTYFTYREFLIYLDQYRRNQLIEKSKPRMNHEKKLGAPSGTVMSPEEPVPSMEDFLSKKKALRMQRKPVIVQRVEVRQGVHFDNFEDDEVRNVQRMFTPSQNSLALTSLNRLSTSFLSPQPKKLLVESTLFQAERETILVFGGINPYANYGEPRNTGNNIFRYLPDSNMWEHVGTMPEPRNHHGVGYLKGRIYLAGGTDPRPDDLRGKSRVVDTVWSFDPTTRAWFSETSLGMKRRNFGLVVLQKNMYVIGGCNDKFESLNSVEKFDPREGVWKFMAPMHYARAGLACAKYRNFIWAAGGTADLKRNLMLDVVESYDVRSNQWTKIKKLISPRCFGCLFVMADNLYLIGGTGQKQKEFKSTTSVGLVDVWDTSNMSWRTIMGMTIPRHGHAVAYVGTQIFIMGGVTTIYMRCLSNIECFCWKRGAWIRGIADLPVTLSGHAAITLPPAMLISNE